MVQADHGTDLLFCGVQLVRVAAAINQFYLWHVSRWDGHVLARQFSETPTCAK